MTSLTWHQYQYLLERLDEEQETATAAHLQHEGPWGVRPRSIAVLDASRWQVAEAADTSTARHIAAWGPDRVLADIKARRELVQRARSVIACFEAGEGPWDDVTQREHSHAVLALEALLRPYAGRDDFVGAWLHA